MSRFSQSSLASSAALTSSQSQVDSLVNGFAEEATNWRSLAAMATGSLFYRFGRIGTLALASRAGQAAPLLQAASYGVGLASEVTAFEGSSRLFATLSGDRSNANLWRWSGRGGWGQGLASSFVTFGMLKSAGHLAEGQNVFVQHLFSDLAMVGGHQTAAVFGVMPRPEGSLAEQLLHAEATNLQLGAGMSLMHSLAPGMAAYERSLDLSLQARERATGSSPSRNLLALQHWVEALAEGGEIPESARDHVREVIEGASVAMSVMNPDEKDGPRTGGATGVRPSYGSDGELNTLTDFTPPSDMVWSRDSLPPRNEAYGFEPRIEPPEMLRKISEDAREDLLEILGYTSEQIDRVNKEDLGRGVGEILETYLIHTIVNHFGAPAAQNLLFDDLSPQFQRTVATVDETIGVLEYLRRSNDTEVLAAAENAMGPMTKAIYRDAQEILTRILGPHFPTLDAKTAEGAANVMLRYLRRFHSQEQARAIRRAEEMLANRNPGGAKEFLESILGSGYSLPQGAWGEEVIAPEEAVLSIGSGDMMGLLALLRHRVAPGELSWRTRFLVSARSQEAADEVNQRGTYRQNPNLKNIQINHREDPPIEVVGPQEYKGLTREQLQRSVRVQMLNVPSKKLHEVLTEDYIRNLPEGAVLFEVIGGLIGPENRGVYQPGPNDSASILPYQLIYQALERYGRRDVVVVSGGGYIPGKDLWYGRQVEMVFASRERGGQAPEAELLARLFAGIGYDNGYIRASFTHHQHSTELGKALKNVTTLKAGLDAGRLARRIIDGAVSVVNPQGEYETGIRGPLYQLMEGLLLYNEVGIKPNRVGYKNEVRNDYWRCSDIQMEEVVRVMREAAKVDVNNKRDMTAFLEREIVQNRNKIASTRNPKRGLAQAIVELWRELGSPYEASEVMPEITEEGVFSLKPLLQLYNYRNHPYERRRLNDAFYDLYEAFHPGETLARPPRIGEILREALRGSMPGISVTDLRGALEGRSEESIRWLEGEIEFLQDLRKFASDSPEIHSQLNLLRRLIGVMREGYEIAEIDHNAFGRPPYENTVLLRLQSGGIQKRRNHQVLLRVQGEQIIDRLTNFGMLLRSFEEGSDIRVVLDVEGNIPPVRRAELIDTLQQVIGAFAITLKESIEVELDLRTPRGVQKIVLQPNGGVRHEVSEGYFEALNPLVQRLRASKGGERVTSQFLRSESATPSRLLDHLLKGARVWPILLDYTGGPLHQGIRSALTRPERSTFIGVYSEGKLVEVFNVYRNGDNQPMGHSHSLLSRFAKTAPEQYEHLSAIDYFDGLALPDFLREFDRYMAHSGKANLEYRILPIRSLPLEEALLGNLEGVNPALLWIFLKRPSEEREAMLEQLTPLYERPFSQVRNDAINILLNFLNPFSEAHRGEILADPFYRFFQQHQERQAERAPSPPQNSTP
ncbi:MAG: hypothetical protein U1F57_05175 [bacterium]